MANVVYRYNYTRQWNIPQTLYSSMLKDSVITKFSRKMPSYCVLQMHGYCRHFILSWWTPWRSSSPKKKKKLIQLECTHNWLLRSRIMNFFECTCSGYNSNLPFNAFDKRNQVRWENVHENRNRIFLRDARSISKRTMDIEYNIIGWIYSPAAMKLSETIRSE